MGFNLIKNGLPRPAIVGGKYHSVQNVLRGITPVASGWDTDPTSLGNCTDGDFSTVTGIGEKILTGAWQYAFLTFDLGSVKTILAGGKVGLYTSANTVNAYIQFSEDGTTYYADPSANAFTTSATEKVWKMTPLIGYGRYVRLSFTATGAATIDVKMYEIVGWELTI